MQGRNCHYSLVKGLVRTTATKEPRRKQESTGQGQNEKSNKNTAVTNTPAHEAQHLHLLTTARHECHSATPCLLLENTKRKRTLFTSSHIIKHQRACVFVCCSYSLNNVVSQQEKGGDPNEKVTSSNELCLSWINLIKTAHLQNCHF